MKKRAPKPEPDAVAAYLEAAPEPARSRLIALADVVRAEAPSAIERIAYGILTWHDGENLIHLGAYKNHVGIYPGAAAIVELADLLGSFKTSKGAIQVPHDVPIPTELMRRLVRLRLAAAAPKRKGSNASG